MPTFKALYGDQLHYETSRALVFGLEEPLPEAVLKHCIHLALHYHQLKGLPLLGASPIKA